MTHNEIEDGMGFAGLVEGPEERQERRHLRTVKPTPAGDNGDCFDCGGFGPCDVCENPVSSASDIARDLARNGLLKSGKCDRTRAIIERHLVANMQLASAPCEMVEVVSR